MFRSRFFWKLYVPVAALVTVFAVLLTLVLDRWLEEIVHREAETTLRDKALVAASLLRNPTRLGSETDRVAAELGVRVTMLDPAGNVLADSDATADMMELHRDRPEVRGAIEHGGGMDRRRSMTVGETMLYVARAVERDDGAVVVARVAVPLASIEHRLDALRRTLWTGSVLGVFTMLVVTLFIVGRAVRPVREIAGIARAMESGDYDRRLRRLPDDETGVLGRALDALAGELSRRTRTISEARAELQAMFAGMVEAVIAVDESDQILFFNPAAGSLLEVDPERAVGRRLLEVTRHVELTRLLEDALENPTEREIRLHKGDENPVLEAHATPFESGRTRGVVAVLHDVTQVRHLEEVRRDFVANVSHELKTPLTSIHGYVETLLGGGPVDRETLERFLRKIQSNADRLGRLVGELLELARIEKGGEIQELHDVALDEAGREALRRYELPLADRRIASGFETTTGPVIVRADPEALRKVLDNLVDNAVKYTPEGGWVKLLVDVEDGLGTIHVEDGGIGIPASDRERIFERFFRVERGRSRDSGGSGLGLAIVRHLVRNMKGEIRVESELGRGSRFTVRLPLAT